jgi:cytoskeletal protein CcmA (bactofilin family)
LFFRRQRSEGVEGLDRIRESLRQQQQERRERGEVDDLLVTDPSQLDEGIEVLRPVREAPEAQEPAPEYAADAGQETAADDTPTVIEPTPFIETAEPQAETVVMETPAPAVETPPAPVTEAPPIREEPAFTAAPPPAAAVSASPVMTSPSMETAVERMRRQETGRATGNGESLIARNATWDGQLYAEGDVRIEGALQGSIEAHSTVFIAQDARVNAKIRARNIVIAGEFDGEISCDEKLEVLPTGSIAGQVNASMLVIHEGAFVDSRFAMNNDSAGARSAR